MAERRMFAKTIIDSDAFLDMPLSTQALYFHLSMRADDDGFINNPKKIQRMVGSSEDDLKLLTAKRFIIAFDNGIIVIKHWKIHNYIQKDRYKPTVYENEKKQLVEKNNKTYTLDTECIQDVYSSETQVRLGKESLGESRKDIVRQDFIFPDYLSEKAIQQVEKGNPDNYEKRIPIAYLNQVTESNYKYVDKNTIPINARFNEGYTLDDFKIVIDKKVAEWKNGDMAKYLRPETLFGTKFDGYLNQKIKNGRLEHTGSSDYDDLEW